MSILKASTLFLYIVIFVFNTALSALVSGDAPSMDQINSTDAENTVNSRGAVAISGDYAVVGASGNDLKDNIEGTAYITMKL